MTKKNAPQTSTTDFDPATLFFGAQPADSRFAEAFRTLRVNLLFSFMEKDLRTLLVTSAGPSEGKSLAVANLGYALAQTGKKVLLVDTDLRKPKLSLLVNGHEGRGLTPLFAEAFSHDVRSGSNEAFAFADLLWLLSFRKKSGILRLTQGENCVKCYIQKGRLADIQWLDGPSDPRLARFLPHGKAISPSDLAALSEEPLTGHRLASFFFREGEMRAEAMVDFMRRHIVEGVKIALQAKDGRFDFEEMALSDFSGIHLDQPLFDLHELKHLYWQAAAGAEAFIFLGQAVDRAIVRMEKEGLSVLPCGPRPPNPSEFLASGPMVFLIGFLKEHFDIVIFDSPPIIPTSDALILAPRVDGVVLMARSGVSDRKMAKKAVDQLHMAKANVLGMVLNQVDFKREGYYRYYSKYYGAYEKSGAPGEKSP